MDQNVCEERIFQELFRKHAKDLHDFLYYKYGSENNASDLVQESFMKLWDNCKKVTIEKARSFLFTVGNNKMLNELSKKKTAFNYQQLDHRKNNLETPEYLAQEKEYMQQLQRTLEALPEGQRTAFMLNRIEGKKHQEIADMLGISKKAVEKRIYTALKKIEASIGKI